MVAGCGPKIAKCFLFVLNICVWICGLILIGAGSYVTAKRNDYADLFDDDTTLIMCWIIIGVGIFTFLVGFAGCCGAMKESACLLRLYWTFMLFIVLAEATGGILAFVYSNDIEDSMMRGMQRTINETYGNKTGATESVDDIQKLFDCCGAANYSDYRYSQHLPAGLAVPASCCKDSSDVTTCTMGTKGRPTNTNLVWPKGCVDESIDTIESNFYIVGGIAIGLLAFEILTMVFACCVISGIQNNDYEKYA